MLISWLWTVNMPIYTGCNLRATSMARADEPRTECEHGTMM